MAVSDGAGIIVVRDMGLVTTVFDERTLSGLDGHLAIGHTRYSTAGDSSWGNSQPVFRDVGAAGFALGHNGNLTAAPELAERTHTLPGLVASDSDLIAELIAEAHSEEEDRAEVTDLRPALRQVVPQLEGAFSLVVVDESHLYGIRDQHGFRPLCLGRLGTESNPEGWILASETPALDVAGATFVREIEPGEVVMIDAEGVHAEQVVETDKKSSSLCIFEFVYFARPDSLLFGQEVNSTRRRMGELLAEQAPVEADLVMGVPDSGVPAAEGFSRRSGIPYGQGLVKNRYIGRTFINPDQTTRANAVRRKFNPLRESIAGKRLVVVDDTIVRGTTQRAVVRMLREAGAREVHLRIPSPPLRWPCFFGIDIPTREELLAAKMSVGEIAHYLDVDSLAYLSLDNLLAAINAEGHGFCHACLTGDYPAPVPKDVAFDAEAGKPAANSARSLHAQRRDSATRSRDDRPESVLQGALPGI